ncbi:hypothetical protein [Burkholderia metallica]|uniref:hypothetical protein n=1 Tax=Burkholderia metallica TaxID=488729 RepID=UPI00157547F2|nr:hypothetical protein [Burkholderia metallica]NTZ09892.1 hypothetical protein [Burkholderia metallica]
MNFDTLATWASGKRQAAGRRNDRTDHFATIRVTAPHHRRTLQRCACPAGAVAHVPPPRERAPAREPLFPDDNRAIAAYFNFFQRSYSSYDSPHIAPAMSGCDRHPTAHAAGHEWRHLKKESS